MCPKVFQKGSLKVLSKCPKSAPKKCSEMTPPDHQKGTNCDGAAAMVSPFKPVKTSLSLTLANSRRQLVKSNTHLSQTLGFWI